MMACNAKYCKHPTDGKHKMCDKHRAMARKGWNKLSEKEQHRRNGNRDPQALRDRSKATNAMRRKLVFDHYGRACVHCGITDEDVLTIDHIDNGGGAHRQVIGKDGHAIFRWLIKENFPAGFQTLCRNCNWKKHIQNLRRGNGDA